MDMKIISSVFYYTRIPIHKKLLLKVMKGLRFCTWYDGSTKKFFMLDPDLINKIQVADFDHFMDLAFTPEQYIKVHI